MNCVIDANVGGRSITFMNKYLWSIWIC